MMFDRIDNLRFFRKLSEKLLNYPLEIARSLWHSAQRRAPAWANASLLPLIFQFKDMVQLASRPMMPAQEFLGPDGADGPKAVGLTPMAGIRNALLAEWPSIRPLRKIPFWSVGTQGFRKSADLVVVEGPLRLIKSLPRHNALILPRIVNHTLDVAGEWQDVCRRFHKSVRRNELRLIRKHGYRFEKSSSTGHFEHFYEEMYLPTVNARHGLAAAVSSKAKLREAFANGFLLRVLKGETYVAAALCEFRASELRLCEIGLLGSNTDLIKQGAMGAIYVGVIQAANNMKCRKADLTVSAPLLFDGLFRHKRRWGTSLSLSVSDQQRVWIQIARYTPAIHRLLMMNPMITVNEDGQLQALVALESIDHWTAAEAARWQEKFFMPGLSSIRVLPLDCFRETGVLSSEEASPEILRHQPRTPDGPRQTRASKMRMA
jgi:hypothetical protein